MDLAKEAVKNPQNAVTALKFIFSCLHHTDRARLLSKTTRLLPMHPSFDEEVPAAWIFPRNAQGTAGEELHDEAMKGLRQLVELFLESGGATDLLLEEVSEYLWNQVRSLQEQKDVRTTRGNREDALERALRGAPRASPKEKKARIQYVVKGQHSQLKVASELQLLARERLELLGVPLEEVRAIRFNKESGFVSASTQNMDGCISGIIACWALKISGETLEPIFRSRDRDNQDWINSLKLRDEELLGMLLEK